MERSNNLLIIFAKNPIKGKVKTRLAKSIGDGKALEIYLYLLQHTQRITTSVNASVAVFYSDQVELNDIWNGTIKEIQKGEDLGERLRSAFAWGFQQGYQNMIVVGTDCYEITSDIVNNAFELLYNNNCVLGPAQDGGYYLIGLNKPIDSLFSNKSWSTEKLLEETIDSLKQAKASYQTLPTLSDIDNIDDLQKFPELVAKFL